MAELRSARYRLPGRLCYNRTFRHQGRGDRDVQAREARQFWRWIRSHGFDGWQVVGSACLVVGVLGFAVLIGQVRPTLPRTHGAFLLETLINPSHQPSAEAQPSTSAPPSTPTGEGAQIAPLPSASRSGLRSLRPSATAPASVGGGTATAAPSPTATDSPSESPTPRPDVHPSAVPTPTPTPRPSIH